MTTSWPPLGALRAFEVAARHASFKRAALELHVTPTAVSHQIRLLETHLGTALFERRVRQVVLTAAGARLAEATREGFVLLARGLDSMRPLPTRASVTISATMAFTSRWLVPRVTAFRAREPALDLSFLASDEAVDLRAGKADVAVRYGKPPWPGLTAELLLRDKFVLACSPQLKLESPKQLAQHALIHFTWLRARPDSPTWPLWFARAGLTRPPSSSDLSFSDETHAVQATLAGQGVGLLSHALIADALASGALVCPFGPELPGGAYYLVYPEGALAEPRLLSVRRWLFREARALRRQRITSASRY